MERSISLERAETMVLLRQRTMERSISMGRDDTRISLLNKNYSLGRHKNYVALEANQESPPVKAADWRAPLIILGFEYLQNVAFSGVALNITVYLSTVLHGSNSSNATIVSIWNGTCFFTPLLGAFVADTYWGRYKTIFLSGLLYILGMVIVTLSSIIPSQPANDAQNVAFFCGLYLVAFGSGGVMSSALPFGADQFNEDDPVERGKKGAFFVWRYFCVTFGTLTSGTLLVWLEEYVNWTLGFGISTACLALAVGGFILGTPTYRKQMPSGSPFKSILQVLTASVMKMRLKPPMDSSLLYEVVGDKNDDIMEQEKLAHTNEFRFFDKAAVVLKSDYKDGIPQLSWTLCTKTQVEELKLLVRLLPIWATSVLFTVAFSQMGTTFIEQGSAMETRIIGSFSIPVASMASFKIACAMAWVIVYNGSGLTIINRMGVGHLMMILTMALAAFIELMRLKSATGPTGKPINIAWQAPQYFMLGGSEIFLYISQSVLFYDEAPMGMKSVCAAFSLLSIALGSYLSSFFIAVVGGLTTAGGGPGWIPDDLNEGHLDYFFWSLAAMCTLNFVAFIAFSRNYVPRKVVLDD